MTYFPLSSLEEAQVCFLARNCLILKVLWEDGEKESSAHNLMVEKKKADKLFSTVPEPIYIHSPGK